MADQDSADKKTPGAQAAPAPEMPVIEARADAAEAGDLQPAERVKNVFVQFNKSLKTIALHRHAAGQYAQYLAPAYELLDDILSEQENLTLTVDQNAFRFANQPVYEEEVSEQNIAFKFYRDRVRLLVFYKGLSEQELLDFALICLTNIRHDDPFADDMVGLMWAKEFEHIDYVQVKSYTLGEESPELSKQEVEKIVAYLYQSLTAVSDDTFQFARLSLEDLELVLDNVEKTQGVTVEGITAREGQKAFAQAEVEKDEKEGLLPRLATILMTLFEEELEPPLHDVIEGAFLHLVESFLLMENFEGVDRLFADFRNLEVEKLPKDSAELVKRIFGRLVAKMSEKDTVVKLAEILETTASEDVYQRIRRYLLHLREPPLQPMLAALEKINRKEARDVLCEALAAHGKQEVELFTSRLHSKKANLVRDMLTILDVIGPEDKLKHVAGLLEHPNLAIRLEAIKSIGASEDPEAVNYITGALNDEDAQVRIATAAVLPERDKFFTRAQLLPIVQKPEFKDRADREQMVFCKSLALTENQEVFDFFSEQVQASGGLLGRKRTQDFKKNIINGLANAGTATTLKFLTGLLESGIKDKEVLSAAERARKRLVEKLEEQEPSDGE